MQEHTVAEAATTQGHALRIGEEQKKAAYNADGADGGSNTARLE